MGLKKCPAWGLDDHRTFVQVDCTLCLIFSDAVDDILLSRHPLDEDCLLDDIACGMLLVIGGDKAQPDELFPDSESKVATSAVDVVPLDPPPFTGM